MQIKLGDKIKALRRRDGRKQEDLSAALGVTNQAVSRWEANKGYPDMELIPAIANYFHVSIDELFGYDNDRETRLASYIEEIDRMRELEGDQCKTAFEEQESYLRKALAEFPNEWKLQMRLAWVLQSKAYYNKKEPDKDVLSESAALYEQARKNCGDEHWKESLTEHLAGVYTQLDEDEKREKLALESSPVNISREMLMCYHKDDEKHKRYTAEAVLALIHSLAWAIDWNWTDSPDVFVSLAGLYKSLFGGKDYGIFSSDMCGLYMRAAARFAKRGDKANALECFGSAYSHYLAYTDSWNKKENRQTSELLSKAVTKPYRFIHISKDMLKACAKTFPDGIANTIKNDKEYAPIFE